MSENKENIEQVDINSGEATQPEAQEISIADISYDLRITQASVTMCVNKLIEGEISKKKKNKSCKTV